MASLARWCFQHRRLVVLFWIIGLVGLGVSSGAMGADYKDDFKLPETESKRALDLLQESFPAQSGETDQIVIHVRNGTLQDPAVKSSVEAMFADVSHLPYVKGVESFYTSDGAERISKDGTIAFANLQLDTPDTGVPKPDVEKIIDAAQKIDSSTIQVELGGMAIQNAAEQEQSLSELIGVVAAAIILFLAFGSIFTMFLPLLTAILALAATTSVVGFLTHAMSVATFAPMLAALIGLGVGVDYALFIVSRHRSNLRQGHTPEESVITALNTSGRAVVFAGITVCIGLLGLMLVGVSFLYGAALASVVAVLFTMLGALTFLPAMLGFVGIKALGRKERKKLLAEGALTHDEMSPGWYKWARLVERHSFVLGALALVVMLVLAIPMLSLRLGSTDAGGDPKDSTTRQAYDLLADGFGPGFNGPLLLAADIEKPGDLDAFKALATTIESDKKAVASVGPVAPSPNGKAAIVSVYPTTSPQDEGTTKLISHLRDHVIPDAEKGSSMQVYVGGGTAIFEDFAGVLTSKLPLFIGAVVGLAFILLMAVFRSLLIPLVASIMNLLAAGAGFGVVVAVFQWGWFGDIVGVSHTGPIAAFLPIMLFAILFGLSMDYEVFLVSRMHEEWVHTQNNDEAIALGQAETGRVITAAAAIMVFVFGSFVLGDNNAIKLFGVGLAAAIAIDALIIRTVLVPSVMHVLGKSNWYLPKWLDRITPRLSVEASDAAEIAAKSASNGS
jgi:RND superfamily putative drug exporter